MGLAREGGWKIIEQAGPNPLHDIVVIGASTGGVSALQAITVSFPADLRASVFIVLHFPPEAPSFLPAILARAGSLSVKHAEDGEAIEYGRIYVAPPDYHLLLKHGCMLLGRGPEENHYRPAIDPLFRSAARAYGPRVVGVVLTGYRSSDGTAGLQAVKSQGGLAIVQDPEEAASSEMPANALRYVDIDYCLPLADIGPILARLSLGSSNYSRNGRNQFPRRRARKPDALKIPARRAYPGLAKSASSPFPFRLPSPPGEGRIRRI